MSQDKDLIVSLRTALLEKEKEFAETNGEIVNLRNQIYEAERERESLRKKKEELKRELKRALACRICSGTGKDNKNNVQTCSGCNFGQVRVDCDNCDWSGDCNSCIGDGWYYVYCSTCNGTGKIYQKCQQCQGTGQFEEN